MVSRYMCVVVCRYEGWQEKFRNACQEVINGVRPFGPSLVVGSPAPPMVPAQPMGADRWECMCLLTHDYTRDSAMLNRVCQQYDKLRSPTFISQTPPLSHRQLAPNTPSAYPKPLGHNGSRLD